VTAAADAATVAGVRISHPDRPIYPDLGITKVDFARYFEAIAGLAPGADSCSERV